jgi:outer membrane protein
MLSAVLFTLVSVGSVAAEDLKIGVFDMQKIMRESKTIAQYRQAFASEIETKSKLLETKQALVKQHEESLAAEAPALSAKDLKTREDRMAAEVRELKRLRGDLDTELQRIDRELSKMVIIDVSGVVNAVGDADNFSLILEKTASGVAYMKAAVDITDKVIAAYDTKK